MMFQQGENSYDATLECLSMIGVVLFISYVVFAYLVTHRGDFYSIRRWKAALWFASISGVILSTLFLFSSVMSVVNISAGKNIYEVLGLLFAVIFSTLSFIIPGLFIVTIGIYRQLKRWLYSDDYLDKIWKAPNTAHKSPIQEL